MRLSDVIALLLDPFSFHATKNIRGSCIEMAKGQGIPEAEMRVEVGDIASYIRGKLIAANETEASRKDRR